MDARRLPTLGGPRSLLNTISWVIPTEAFLCRAGPKMATSSPELLEASSEGWHLSVRSLVCVRRCMLEPRVTSSSAAPMEIGNGSAPEKAKFGPRAHHLGDRGPRHSGSSFSRSSGGDRPHRIEPRGTLRCCGDDSLEAAGIADRGSRFNLPHPGTTIGLKLEGHF